MYSMLNGRLADWLAFLVDTYIDLLDAHWLLDRATRQLIGYWLMIGFLSRQLNCSVCLRASDTKDDDRHPHADTLHTLFPPKVGVLTD